MKKIMIALAIVIVTAATACAGNIPTCQPGTTVITPCEASWAGIDSNPGLNGPTVILFVKLADTGEAYIFRVPYIRVYTRNWSTALYLEFDDHNQFLIKPTVLERR